MPRPFCLDPLGPAWPTFAAINDFWDLLQPGPSGNESSQSLVTSASMQPTCSEDTIFVWIPSLLLAILSIFELNQWQRFQKLSRNGNGNGTHKTSPPTMPLTAFQLTKLFTTAFIVLLLLARLVYWLLYADHFRLNGLLWKDSSAPALADVIRFITFLLLLQLFFLHRRYQMHSSAAVFLYLALNVIPNVYTLVTLLNELFASDNHLALYESPFAVLNHPFMLTTKLLYIFALGFLFVIYSFSDKDALRSKGTLRDKLLNPEVSASYFSRISFEWFTSLIIKAHRVTVLQQEHLWLLDASNLASVVIAPFEGFLAKIRRRTPSGIRLNVIKLLAYHYWAYFLLIGVIKLIASLFIFVNPVVLDWIITFMDPTNREAAWRGYFYCSLMFLSPMLESFFTSQYEYHINVLTMRMKTCLTAIVYSKSFRLSNSAKQQFTTGEIVNFLAVDSQRIVDFFNNLNIIWSAPVQIIIGVYLLWLQLGYAAFAGFSCMLIIVPLNIWITNILKNIQMSMMTFKDQRSKLMDQILNGIKVIKLNSWEDYFEGQILAHRKKEMHHLRRFAYANTFMSSIFSSAAFLVALFSFLAFTLMSSENILNANKAFVSLALFNIIRVPMAFLPMLLSYAGVALVSIARINEYLNAPEIDTDAIRHLPNEPSFSPDWPSETSQSAVKIVNGAFSWLAEDPAPTLSGINCEIGQNQLVAIVGSVGSGKSSLLSAMLGEMVKLSGSVEIHGSVAYVPQEAWIRNATIRENILLDKPFDEKKYKRVIEECALGLDLAMFTAGDMTEVGEKGINLSGGQKQRISIARAVYSNADIYVLDDPLSALDAHVSRHIFDSVIGPNGCLKGRTRLLVTHKLVLLPQAQQVLYVADGQLLETGNFKQLIDSQGPFSEYVAEYFLDKAANTQAELDEDDLEFMSSVEPQIQAVIQKIELSRSLSRTSEASQGVRPSVVSRSMSRNSQRSIRDVSSSMVSSNRSGQSDRTIVLDSAAGKLTQVEGMAEGSVNMANKKKYFAIIGWFSAIAILFGLALSNVFQVFSSLWLSDWSNDALNPAIVNDTQWRDTRIIVYAVLGIFETVSNFFATLATNLVCVTAAKVVHNQMIANVLRAPMSFFDQNPIGRILNRCTRDIDIIDLQIAISLRLLSMQIFRTIVAFGLISLETPIILALLIPLAVVYYFTQRIYINTSRQLKRIEAVTRSPINNCLSESVSGATSIRTYGLIERFHREMRHRIDDNNTSYWLNFAASRWLAIRLEFLSYSIVFLSTIFAVSSKGTLSPGIAGLAISYSLNITSILNIFIRGYTDLETNFVSIERVVEYTNVKIEKDANVPEEELTQPPADWPMAGAISFRNYSTQYRPGLKLCLKRLNLNIAPATKVAVVGRTGSGKSSLALALLRILDPVEGSILIDGLDITSINHKFVRRNLNIVPQEPVLFIGTLRSNVDLYHMHSDEEVFDVLRRVNLEPFLEQIEYNLNYSISSANENLSAGQRQLICLARALIRNKKVCIFDEATALVDYETDQSIHSVIFSEKFTNVTVLFIAHRLDKILDYDKVLVMNNGEIVEYDDPKLLVEDEMSSFHAMAKEANII